LPPLHTSILNKEAVRLLWNIVRCLQINTLLPPKDKHLVWWLITRSSKIISEYKDSKVSVIIKIVMGGGYTTKVM
jgi:hypothetical protein